MCALPVPGHPRLGRPNTVSGRASVPLAPAARLLRAGTVTGDSASVQRPLIYALESSRLSVSHSIFMAEGTLGRMAGRARRMSAAGLVLTGGMVAGLAGPASAAVRPPQLSLSASAASPAASVQVTGAGFRGLEAVTISLGTTRLATARTSRTG